MSTPPDSLRANYDVIVAGAGTGGIGAAIQAARLGVSVLLVEETDWVGGQMLAAGVTAMDEGGGGNPVRERGLYRELVERIQNYYLPLKLDPFSAGPYANFRFEPRVGRRIVHAMLAEARGSGTLDLSLRARVVRVHRQGNTVTGVDLEIGAGTGRVQRTISSRILIDATEWGDVLPLSGARYRAGNHTSDALDRARRIQDNTWTAVIKQYPAGVPDRLRIKQPPPGYDAMHPVFAKLIVAGDTVYRRGSPMSWTALVDYRGMPDSSRPAQTSRLTRTHLNYTNDTPCTVAELEDPVRRLATDRAMRLRTLQLLHYIQNVLGLSDWAVADDEGFDSPYNREQIDTWVRERPELQPFREILHHFSVIPYVRESRRIVGVHTLLAREISRGPGKAPQPFPTSIGLGDYRLDLHGGKSREDLELDLDRLEDVEDAQPGRAGPFAIPCECLIPESIDGLLAAEKNISQTRLVSGASRMQPHTLNVGQAAGALAALAVRHGVAPRRIEPVLVQRVLLDARDTLNLTPVRDVAPKSADWPAIQLVTVHGMLPLEQGQFAPTRPLTRQEMETVLQRLTSLPTALPGISDPVTRSDFAKCLSTAAGSAPTIAFSAVEKERIQPITRSEAAQVIAEFMELRALARLDRAPQTLQWNSIKPASVPISVEPKAALVSELRRLREANIIVSVDYWADHAVAGRDCDGALVAELLLRGARLFEPAASAETALEVLLRARVISARDYWAKSAVPGGHCDGKNVAVVIRRLAEHAMRAKSVAPTGKL